MDYVELERVCIRDYTDFRMTIPQAIEWLQEHLAKIPPELHGRSVFAGEMETGYYEGDVDCFMRVGFYHDEPPPGGVRDRGEG